MTSLKNTTLTTLAKTARYALQRTEDSVKKEFTGSYYEGASQDESPLIGVRNRDGIIITPDNRYIGVVEIFPINFNRMPPERKKRVLDNFGDVFNMKWYKYMFKVMSDYTDVKDMIQTVIANSQHLLTNEHSRECLNDYINFIYREGSTNAIVRRYFFFWEYNGENGIKAKDFSSISKTMHDQRQNFIKKMNACGNSCVEFHGRESEKKYNEFVENVVYKFFNRKSCLRESFQERKRRIDADFARFNKENGTNKTPVMADYLAPKGLYFLNREYMCEDGQYYTYIGIKGNNFPNTIQGGIMTDVLAAGAYVDCDYIFKVLPRETVLPLLKFYNTNTHRSMLEKYSKGKDEKGGALKRKFINNKTVYDALSGDTELVDMSIIITIHAPTYELMDSIAKNLKHHYKEKLHLQIADATNWCEDYWIQTMPFLYNTPIFNKLALNILSDRIAAIYPFTTFQLYDTKGCVLGISDNGTIVSPNWFDTDMFINANMTIIGSSGSGKTFTEELIGRRMYLNGCRSYFIIPKKGLLDYYDGCANIGGTFISLAPGARDRINVMDIRPEGKAVDANGKKISGSWMTHKIVNLCAWISLLMNDTRMTTAETNALQKALIRTYAKKGITVDNKSLYKNIQTGELKEMPILGELYEEVVQVDSLNRIANALEPFVSGIASNMNGQTNVDIENARYVVFDVDEDKIPEEMFSSFLYLAFDYVYNVVKEDITSKDLIFLDEVWKMMVVPDAAKQVSKMIKLIRAYGGSAVIATQQMGDFNKAGDIGMDILNNAEINLYLAMKPQDITETQKLMSLSRETVADLEKLEKTHGLLVTRKDKLFINIKATDMECEVMSTDINDRIEKEASVAANAS